MKILFIDDDLNVLDGIHNALRKKRNVWDMEFANSGGEALDLMSRYAPDVVVTDMRMPGMDGATVLDWVKKHRPESVRIVLSGQTDQEAFLRSVPNMHQFVGKPCSITDLCEILERIERLQDRINAKQVRAVVGHTKDLPVVPDIYWKLNELLLSEDVSVNTIFELVQSEPSLAARILQIANSAYFGSPRQILSVRDGISFLGFEAVKSIVLCKDLFMFADSPASLGLLKELTKRSMESASIASKFIKNREISDAAYTASLLKDLGLILLAKSNPTTFKLISERLDDLPQELAILEMELFGVTHAQVGAYLLGVWGLPFTVIEAVACHECPEIHTDSSNGVIVATHVADCLTKVKYGSSNYQLKDYIDFAFIQETGLEVQVLEWLEAIDIRMAA